MAEQSIIIVSDRLRAIQQIQNSNGRTAMRLYDVNSIEDEDKNNNKWKTHLEYGIQIDIGDRIQVESAMINSVGSSSDTMEFIGDTGLKDNQDRTIDDSRGAIDLGFYITNRYQFNFPLPKSTTEITYNMYSNNYGLPDLYGEGRGAVSDVQQFSQFVKSYPYRSIEGFDHDNGTPQNFTAIPNVLDPSFSKPPYPLIFPNSDRLYLGIKEFQGPYYDEYLTSQPWDFFTSQVKIEVDKGFSTPANVGSKVREQFHSRDGQADNWSSDLEDPVIFQIDEVTGEINRYGLPSLTDSTFKTVPSSTGQLFYNRSLPKSDKLHWGGSFNGERDEHGNLVPPGTGYDALNGVCNLYSYLLCGNPFQYKAMSDFNIYLQQRPALDTEIQARSGEIFTLYTGNIISGTQQYQGDTYSFGETGNFPQLIDEIPFENQPFQYTDSNGATQINPEAACLKLSNGNVIATNMLFNRGNVLMLERCYKTYSEITSNSDNISRNNPDFLNSNSVPYVIGKIDDELTKPYDNKIIYMSNINLEVKKTTNPTFYNQCVGNNPGNSYSEIMHRDPGDNTLKVSTPSLYGFPGRRGVRYEVLTKKFLPSTHTAKAAMRNEIPGATNLYPHNPDSNFQTKRPDGNLTAVEQDYEIINEMIDGLGLGIIPIYYKSSANPYLQNIPLIGIIVNQDINPENENERIPRPRPNEFLSVASQTSLNQNSLSKVITTQKIYSDHYPTSSISNPQETIDPQVYMPFVYIGSSDLNFQFDADFSRFTFSQLHTPIYSGNGVFQNVDRETNTNAQNQVSVISESEAAISIIDAGDVKTPYAYITAFKEDGNSIMSAQAGVAFLNLYVMLNTGQSFLKSPLLQITESNQMLYKNSLFDKCGFLLEQLMPYMGTVQADFNRCNHNKYLGYEIDALFKYNNMVKPFTTNNYSSSADLISYVLGTAGPIANPNPPMYNLGSVLPDTQSEINGESDLLIGFNLPRKLDYSYLTVNSDIVKNSRFYASNTGRQLLNSVAYITRNYAEGDFLFSFSTTWDFIADMSYVISDITTEILLPNGRAPMLDGNSSIIYRITKPKIMPIEIDPMTKKEIQDRKKYSKRF